MEWGLAQAVESKHYARKTSSQIALSDAHCRQNNSKETPAFEVHSSPQHCFCIAEKRILIFSFPAVCTTATKVQVLPLSITSILVPLQELMKQHVAYLLLHILPTAMLFQVKILPDTDSAPQEKASFGHSSIQPVIPSRPPIRSRAILARLHSAYPICPTMTRCYDLYHWNVLLSTFKSLL